jgi:hypothetical protein
MPHLQLRHLSPLRLQCRFHGRQRRVATLTPTGPAPHRPILQCIHQLFQQGNILLLLLLLSLLLLPLLLLPLGRITPRQRCHRRRLLLRRLHETHGHCRQARPCQVGAAAAAVVLRAAWPWRPRLIQEQLERLHLCDKRRLLLPAPACARA